MARRIWYNNSAIFDKCISMAFSIRKRNHRNELRGESLIAKGLLGKISGRRGTITMYRRDAKGWLKHLDFMVLDLLTLQISFVLSYILRHGIHNPYAIPVYANMSIFLTLFDLVIIFFTEPFRNILKRGYYLELEAIVQQALLLEAFAVFFLFASKSGENYSRASMFLMGLVYIPMSYVIRIIWKSILKKNRREGGRSLLIVSGLEEAEKAIASIRLNNYGTYRIAGLVLLEDDPTVPDIGGVKVVANLTTAIDYAQKQWVDEVLIALPENGAEVSENDLQVLMRDFVEMGITVHLSLSQVVHCPGRTQIVEKVGDYTVLTTSMNYATTRQAILKRTMDILGGLVGCLITAVLFVFVAPAIFISSPGPIFFAQERIGKNGRRFKMYKFRSMYLDAEARKKELLAQNKINDGLMFKLDFDPRIIGNKILPDGTRKTGVGQFIRSTSIDEFPQFFNVLKGDMSLVGTRPPLVSEFDAYQLRHRARMAVKPGITGLWQVSGRSEITDFEEVVRLDTQYIDNWSMGLDMRILLQTVVAVLKRRGSI